MGKLCEPDSLTMSLTCFEPLVSSSDSTMASKVKDATRKKKSLTPSPGTSEGEEREYGGSGGRRWGVCTG